MKYIDNFKSLVPALQGNKVINRVEGMKEAGEIQTETEYNNKLSELLAEISTDEFKPTFKYMPLKEGRSSSEHFNYLMDRIYDDLDVAFTELNNIFATVKAHDIFFRDKLLDDLHFTLKAMEDEVDGLIDISDTRNAFDNVLTNSFSGENFSLSNTDPVASEILYDNRKEERITDNLLGFIDSREEALMLPLSDKQEIPFTEVQVVTADSTDTVVDIKVADSKIENIIDLDVSSGWTHNILRKEILSDGAKLSIELNLGDKREINYLTIHPVSDFPMLLESIKYIDINNESINIPDTSLFNTSLNKPVTVSFIDIIAKKIVLNLKQDNSVLFDYVKNKEITIDDLKRDNSSTRSTAILSEEIVKTIQDPDILSVIPVSEVTSNEYDVYNHYIFAFKEISTGLSAYKSDGYFISREYRIDIPQRIAIETKEIIPEYFNVESGSNEKIGSFEYTIIKKDYNENNELIQDKIFSILPTGCSSVSGERLFFDSTRRIIPLRFLGHYSDNDGSDIQIYRNNIELTRGVDWRFSDRSNQLDNSDSTLQPGTSYTNIEILHSSDVIRTGIYTANYIPRQIKEPNTSVERDGIIYFDSGATEHQVHNGVENVSYSNIYLKTVMRNNSFEDSKTVKLEHYKILSSSVDENKYVRIWWEIK